MNDSGFPLRKVFEEFVERVVVLGIQSRHIPRSQFSELCPDAEIAEGLTANDLDDIEPWIQRLGIME